MTEPVRLASKTQAQPTLAEVRQWPATCSVRQAARAIGCSPTHLANLIRRGESPIKCVPLGSSRRQLVITADLVRLLSGEDRGAA
ncbi:DNA-binding protein [Streptomyces sp. AK02-04a]|uniref:DNA-binding protein n=1 Tax=Streptomyces sp. AK02-04a TaxID=3028649 RepID=UPI0029BD5B90|nr:DNA-binding protein [Streptomyces sp. AK02-04a]MDX3753993.1 DNA-binding protein [Streptomyces sp. AK02-04a]